MPTVSYMTFWAGKGSPIDTLHNRIALLTSPHLLRSSRWTGLAACSVKLPGKIPGSSADETSGRSVYLRIFGILLSCFRKRNFTISTRCFSFKGLLPPDAVYDKWGFKKKKVHIFSACKEKHCSFYFHTNIMLCSGKLKLFSVGLKNSD